MKRYFLVIILVLVITGCAKQDQLDVLVFGSDQPAQLQIANNQQANVELLSNNYERLIMEIASHNGDVLVVDQTLVNTTVFDPEGLVPLDNLLAGDNNLTALKGTDPNSGETNTYGLKIEGQSDQNQTFIVMVPKYSRNQADALAIIAALTGTSNK
ncbi:hypothetical protein SAMN04488134_101292 [Amphibacillus marinus]|uniref:Lipoprotein n=1 Tax=Amphibacillus marinus TaxID=872970 RepID=A0A1H8HA82_9BACI|nr:hypothetical protein [Amphibacillus marinus]SEN53116.1 hypothetical protein SAMN04488134_101292 [Amphibacillus marinus]